MMLKGKNKKLLVATLAAAMVMSGGAVVAVNQVNNVNDTYIACAEDSAKTTSTSVTGVDVYNGGVYLDIKLSTNDYTIASGSNSTTNNAFTNGSEYGTKAKDVLDKVELYLADGVKHTLSEANANEGNLNFASTNRGYCFKLLGAPVSYRNDAIKKVVIPAGTKFPTKAYVDGGAEEYYITKATATFELNNGVYEKQSVQAIEHATAVNGVKYNGSKHYAIALTNNDYGSATSGNITGLANYASKVSALKDSVQVVTSDGATLSVSQVKQDGEEGLNYIGTNSGFTFKVNNDYMGKIVKIIIPAGAKFPSLEYLNGGDEEYYVTDKAVTYNLKTGTTTFERELQVINHDTEVAGVKYTNGFLYSIQLTENDYGTASTTANAFDANYTTMYADMLAKVKVTTESGEVALSTAFQTDGGETNFNYNGSSRGYCFKVLSAYRGTITKMTIPAGTKFPSKAYATGASQDPEYYVTTKDVSYVWNGTEFVKEIKETLHDTAIAGVRFNGSSVYGIQLTENDYGTQSTTANAFNANYTTIYADMLAKVKVVTASGEVALSTAFQTEGGEANFNYHGTSWGYCFKVLSAYRGTISQVIIPAGTKFPSKAYVTGEVEDPEYYVTKEDAVYDYNATTKTFSEHVDINEVATSIDIIKYYNDNRFIIFGLTENDFAQVSAQTAINMQNLTDYVNMLDKITVTINGVDYKLSQIATANNPENFYNITNSNKGIAIKINDPAHRVAPEKIVIEEGCTLPSAGITAGTGNTIYKVANTTTYVKSPDGNYRAQVEEIVHDTTVAGISFTNGYIYSFKLSASDYGTTSSTTNIYNDKYVEMFMDMLYNVKVTTASGEVALINAFQTDGGEAGINYHNTGVGCGVKVLSAYRGTITKVVIPAGTKFPSLAYINGTSEKPEYYVTTEDVVYDYGTKSNAFIKHVDINEIETSVNIIKYYNENRFIIFDLSANDYADTKSETSINMHNYIDYVSMLDKITVTINGVDYKLSQIATANNPENFFNITNSNKGIAIKINDPAHRVAPEKIVIEEGCVFPSVGLTSGANGNVYKVAETTTYVKSLDGNYRTQVEETLHDTTVAGVTFTNGSIYSIKLGESDYGTTSSNTNIYNDKYVEMFMDMLYNVKVTTASGEVALINAFQTVSGEAGINYYNTGIGCCVKVLPAYRGTITKVVIPAGTKFPSLAYINGTSEKPEYYVTTAEATYVYFDGAFTDKQINTMNTSKIVVTEAHVDGEAKELFGFTVKLPTGIYAKNVAETRDLDAFDWNYANVGNAEFTKYLQRILINGVSILDINENTDDSEYVYSTNPMNSENAAMSVPVLVYVRYAEGEIYIRMHKDYAETLGNSATVTLSADFNYRATDGSYMTLSEAYSATAYRKLINISFKNGNDTVIETMQVRYGDTPEYEGTKPNKTADAQYSYVWTGEWDKELSEALEDTVYVATFTPKLRSYEITFVNGETEISSSTLNYGETIVAPEALSNRDEDNYHYEFLGWECDEVLLTEGTTVSGLATYSAKWNKTAIEYTATFVNGEETIEVKFSADKPLVAPEVEKSGYNLIGWKDAQGNVVDLSEVELGDVTLTASWDSVPQGCLGGVDKAYGAFGALLAMLGIAVIKTRKRKDK